MVGQPFHRTCIDQGRHPHRLSLIVDLAIEIADLKLGHILHHASHFPVSQKFRRRFVQQGNLIVIRRFNVFRKFPLFHCEEPLISVCIHHGGG